MEIVFSIIMPVYNVEQYLGEAVSSVLEQKFNRYEIILVDDGSTDSSGKICDQVADTYRCAKVIHQSNQGLSVARNKGMEAARGKYIVFLDSDDKLSKEALENLYRTSICSGNPDFIISRRETMCTGNGETKECAYIFPVNKLEMMSRTEVYDEIQNYPDMWMGAWIFTISNEYVKKNQLYFYPGLLHEDEEWVPRVFFSNGTIGYNNELLYVNRPDRVGSITSVPNIKRLFDRIFIVEELGMRFTSESYGGEIEKCVRKRRASIVFGVIADLKRYSDVDRFEELLGEINCNIALLRDSGNVKYRMVYMICKIFNPYKASLMIGMFNK